MHKKLRLVVSRRPATVVVSRSRRFIAAFPETSRSWSADKQSENRAWIEWAARQADRMDPLVSEKPPSVLDRKRELNRWGNGVW